MIRGFNRHKTLILILLVVLFGGASLVGLGSADAPLDPSILKLRYVLAGTSLLVLLLMSRFNMWRFHSKAVPLLIVWTLFSYVLVISGLSNNDSISVRDGFWFMIGIPIIFFNALPKLMKENANLLIAIALFLAHLPYIVMSLWLHPLNTSLYQGVFANSNQMGFIGAEMAAGIFILLIAALSAKRAVSYVALLILLLFGTFTIILIANSRTSLLAFFAMFSIFILKSILNPKSLFKITFITTAIIGTMLFLVSEQINFFWRNIELGFISKSRGNETLSGREEIWGKTLNDINLLGHGSDYFELNFGLGAHNTIIEILGRNGLIAAYLILFFGIASLLYAYFYCKSYVKEDPYAISPLIITVCFWVQSMGEGMFGSLGNAMTLAYMLSIGVVMTKSNTEQSKKRW